MRRRLRVVVGVIGVLAASLPAAADESTYAAADEVPPPIVVDDIDVLHYNIHKGADADVVGAVIEQIRAERPEVVSINEACGHHVERFLAELEPLGYAGNYAIKGDLFSLDACPAIGELDTSQGAAIFVAGPVVEGSDDDIAINQAAACITRATAPPLRACSVHLPAPNDVERDEDITAEIRAMQSTIFQHAESMPLIVAGDFNVGPWDPALQELYQDFMDLDMNSEACPPWKTSKVPPGATLHGGGCTFEHTQQGGKKIDYVFVDRRHFDPEISGRVQELTCPDSSRADGWCSDHRQLWGTAVLHPQQGTAWRGGIAISSGGNLSGGLTFGEPSNPGASEILSQVIGGEPRTFPVDDIAPECTDTVDSYLAWGDADPTFAAAITEDALAGYRLFADVASPKPYDDVPVGSPVADLPDGFLGLPLSVSYTEGTGERGGTDFELTGLLHPYPDLGTLDTASDDATILERGAGEQCGLTKLVAAWDEQSPEGEGAWAIETWSLPCGSDALIGCLVEWYGTLAVRGDGSIEGTGSLDWEQDFACFGAGIGEVHTMKVTATQDVVVSGELAGEQANLTWTFAPAAIEHDPPPECLAPDGSGELTTAESQRVLDELKAFIEAPGPVEVQVDMPVDEFDRRRVFDDEVEMTLGGQTVGLHVCDQGLFPCVP